MGKIIWTEYRNTAPANTQKVIVDQDGVYSVTTGKSLRDRANFLGMFQQTPPDIRWTPHTEERWKELHT